MDAKIEAFTAQPQDESARLDSFLSAALAGVPRSMAQQLIAAGKVLLNGKEAKPSATVQVGDIIEMRFGERIMRVEVLSVAEHAVKADAAELYRVLEA